jgi:hypothetical protein
VCSPDAKRSDGLIIVNAEPAVGSAPPSAGVTPAPGGGKGEDARLRRSGALVRGSSASLADDPRLEGNTIPGLFAICRVRGRLITQRR